MTDISPGLKGLRLSIEMGRVQFPARGIEMLSKRYWTEVEIARAKRDVKQLREAMDSIEADWDWTDDFIDYVETFADESAIYIETVKHELGI